MNRHDLAIYDKIVNLGERLKYEIASIKQNNPQLIEFLESNDDKVQNLLIDSKWGSGKTYTLKVLSFGEFSKIKEQLAKLTFDPIIKNNLEDLKSCNNILEFKEKYNKLQIKPKKDDQNNLLNLNRLLIQFDKYIFVNLDEFLYSNNWIEELYFAIAQELWNHKVLGEKSKFKDWAKTIFNLDERDIDEWKKESLGVGKSIIKIVENVDPANKMWIKVVDSGIRLLPLRKKYRDKINGKDHKNINDIYELINNEDKSVFVFENLERVTDVKIMEFFGQFNPVFNNSYENKHKFIFNVDEEVLKEKLNDNAQHREKYLNKYFDQKLTLVTSDEVKINLVNDIIDNSFYKLTSVIAKDLFNDESHVFNIVDLDDFSIEWILYLMKMNISYELNLETRNINQEFIDQIKIKSVREIEKVHQQGLKLIYDNKIHKWQPIWQNMNFILKLGIVLFINEHLKEDIISYNHKATYEDVLNNLNIPYKKIVNSLKIIPMDILEKYVKIKESITTDNLIPYEIINEI